MEWRGEGPECVTRSGTGDKGVFGSRKSAANVAQADTKKQRADRALDEVCRLIIPGNAVTWIQD